ncbi:hypothetical protein [Rhodococcus sp. BUPNP1]|uniref:hypothetical protein n=1 Tax=Rhodococcus sp. BUPNP1 TaxID=1432786 RepID=UPI000B5A6BAF|nr:hypothetical protein [Rhodococcus sp. BUPNP1]OWY79972.1 hypothetical protein B9C99_20090 [Rhodococcus sp. BUPNP1]
MTDAQTLEAPTENATIRTVRRWSPGACVWCGDTDSVEVFRNEPRCATCRKHEAVIDEARKFMGMYGLRPIGGTLQSDDEEEYEHRLAAREARRALNDIRLAEQPDPALVRKALRPRAAAITESHTGSSAQTSRPSSASRSSSSSSSPKPAKNAAPVRTGAVDVEEIQTRALALLDQLSAIDAQLALVAEQSGLAARARRSDLEKQKATILRTLAALEKARLSASGS